MNETLTSVDKNVARNNTATKSYQESAMTQITAYL